MCSGHPGSIAEEPQQRPALGLGVPTSSRAPVCAPSAEDGTAVIRQANTDIFDPFISCVLQSTLPTCTFSHAYHDRTYAGAHFTPYLSPRVLVMLSGSGDIHSCRRRIHELWRMTFGHPYRAQSSYPPFGLPREVSSAEGAFVNRGAAFSPDSRARSHLSGCAGDAGRGDLPTLADPERFRGKRRSFSSGDRRHIPRTSRTSSKPRFLVVHVGGHLQRDPNVCTYSTYIHTRMCICGCCMLAQFSTCRV